VEVLLKCSQKEKPSFQGTIYLKMWKVLSPIKDTLCGWVHFSRERQRRWVCVGDRVLCVGSHLSQKKVCHIQIDRLAGSGFGTNYTVMYAFLHYRASGSVHREQVRIFYELKCHLRPLPSWINSPWGSHSRNMYGVLLGFELWGTKGIRLSSPSSLLRLFEFCGLGELRWAVSLCSESVATLCQPTKSFWRPTHVKQVGVFSRLFNSQ
jgi:hypothetical protein